MTDKRVKKAITIAVPTTRAEMESLVERIARASASLNELVAQMATDLIEVRARFEPQLSAYQVEREAALDSAKAWADANPGEFGGKKSIELVHGQIGYRTGMPRLKTTSGWTWDRVLEKLCLMKLTNYIRGKQEVDKEKIIADRETLADRLPLMGVRGCQEESFYVEPKSE